MGVQEEQLLIAARAGHFDECERLLSMGARLDWRFDQVRHRGA
jgi:hypothetical protein